MVVRMQDRGTRPVVAWPKRALWPPCRIFLAAADNLAVNIWVGLDPVD